MGMIANEESSERSSKESESVSLDRAHGMAAAATSQRRAGAGDRISVHEDDAIAVIDLTSGDEGSNEDTDPVHANSQKVDNARGSSDNSAASSSHESLPKTPRVKHLVRGVGNPVDLTPNFRSAAAMAGWDDEALLMAALGQDSPVHLLKRDSGRGTPEGSPQVGCSDRCGRCPVCRERKRGTRTPGQAATPLSAARRHRRLRRNASNEEPLAPIPMAVLNIEDDKNGGPVKTREGCKQQVPAGEKENHPEQCAKPTSPRNSVESSLPKEAIRLEQLREELTCVVCLDICLEPSTTSCGHSFCRSCLQSVFQKCGMRCPKCRQHLRTNSASSCPINTVLWNTIQLLFPHETAARIDDQKKSSAKQKKPETSTTRVTTEQPQPQSRPGLVRRISRPIPWRQLTTWDAPDRTRPPGNYRSFQRASVLLDSWQSTAREQVGREGGIELLGRSRRTTSLQRNPQTLRQEQADAALAARLQESYISQAGL